MATDNAVIVSYLHMHYPVSQLFKDFSPGRTYTDIQCCQVIYSNSHLEAARPVRGWKHSGLESEGTKGRGACRDKCPCSLPVQCVPSTQNH